MKEIIIGDRLLIAKGFSNPPIIIEVKVVEFSTSKKYVKFESPDSKKEWMSMTEFCLLDILSH